MVLAILTVVAITYAALSPATPSLAVAGTSGHACSSTGAVQEFFVVKISARRVSCRAARRFIVAINKDRRYLKTKETHFRRFDCQPYQAGVPDTWIRCVRGRQLIHWLQGT
ncbi:MAG: hypothetical protein JSS68_13990 [Actinobacteria bacterium]|nr:hypothetical protein [Actinomycetota bacterium]